MRCKYCGSANVVTEAQHASEYSYSKGLLGVVLLGPLGVIAGINGRDSLECRYHCLACGIIGNDEDVLMDSDTEEESFNYLSENNVAGLRELKKQYRNIEWTPPVSATSVTDENGFETDQGVLIEYHGFLQDITIPSHVTAIGNQAFWRCENLRSVSIPNNVTTIGKEAFYNCVNLESVTIPTGVISIGEAAFANSKLRSVVIPDSVQYIEKNAFRDCKDLSSVTLSNGLKFVGEGAFASCPLASIDIPDGVTQIGKETFRDCRQLTSVTIPNGVTAIENSIFENCESLTCVNIPSGVTTIGEKAFACCKKLTTIVIPNGVTGIGHQAFYKCGKLTSIIIPESVIAIDEGAFEECPKINSFEFENYRGWTHPTPFNFNKPIKEKILKNPKSASAFMKQYCKDAFYCDKISLDKSPQEE